MLNASHTRAYTPGSGTTGPTPRRDDNNTSTATTTSTAPNPMTSTPLPSRTIVKSATYPRVAVLLGVPRKWFVPLLLCRGLSVGFVVWWAVTVFVKLWWLLVTTTATTADRGGGAGGSGSGEGDGRRWMSVGDGDRYSRFQVRLVLVQIGLAYLWAFTAAYLSHLFVASLMSRWLQHYSPLAVLVRLCSLNFMLSYALTQIFFYTGAMDVRQETTVLANLENLSVGFPVWMCVSIALLLGYFSTQQDISVDSDGDDRRRRLVLRFKCLVAVAGTSLVSLAVLVVTIRLGETSLPFGFEGMLARFRDLKHITSLEYRNSRTRNEL